MAFAQHDLWRRLGDEARGADRQTASGELACQPLPQARQVRAAIHSVQREDRFGGIQQRCQHLGIRPAGQVLLEGVRRLRGMVD